MTVRSTQIARISTCLGSLNESETALDIALDIMDDIQLGKLANKLENKVDKLKSI